MKELLIPQYWQIKKIGELCTLMTGGTPSKANPSYFDGGEIKWLVSGDIHLKEIFDCPGRITQAGYDNSNAKFLPINSVIIALNGQGKTKGSVALLRTKATCNQSLVSIYPKNTNELLPEYLFHNLNGRYLEIRKLVGDDDKDRRGLNMPIIRGIQIPVPPIEEQKRIVEILDKAFEGIAQAEANTRRNLINARELFDSYLNQIFIQKKGDWETKTIADISTKIEYGSSSKSAQYENNDSIPVLRMGNIQNGLINWNDLVYTDRKDEIEKYSLQYNDVLFNRTNSDIHVGKSGIYKGERPAIFAGYLIRIHYKKEEINPDFLNFYLNSSIAREYGSSVMSRSINQANINGTKLKSYPIYIPSLPMQNKIVDSLYKLKNQVLPNLQCRKFPKLPLCPAML